MDPTIPYYHLPPELDFCSDSFDPVSALKSDLRLPFPYAKTYNNLAEYHSHTFLKKDSLKRVEKDRPYDRDYSFYYATLGLDSRAQERYEQRRLQRLRRKKYAGLRTARLRKYFANLNDDPNREPCRSYPPLRSTKIVQTKSALRKFKIIPKTSPPDVSGETKNNDQINDISELGKALEGNLKSGNVNDPEEQTSSVISNKSYFASKSEVASKNFAGPDKFSRQLPDKSFPIAPATYRRTVLSENSVNSFENKYHSYYKHNRNRNYSLQNRSFPSRHFNQPENRDPRRRNKHLNSFY